MARLLKIEGRIALDQFWPEGASDADTTKIALTVAPGAFSYDVEGQGFTPTDVFEDAVALGQGRKKVISASRRITVRLQGVDAPELHYKAAALPRRDDVTPALRDEYNALNRKEKRQWLGESATVALADFLRGFGAGSVPCQFYSFVETPGDVIDTYGRFVGNIMVGPAFDIDLNLWLTAEGWVYPTFYASMDDAEIQLYLDALPGARAKGRCWAAYSRDIRSFERDLVYRGEGAAFDAAQDAGPVLMPKLFRRLVAFDLEKAVGLRRGSFKTYLKERRDGCYALADFMEQGPFAATPRTLDAFQRGPMFRLEPHELVFQEKPSTLVDGAGRRITRFFG
jgi:endonuclease YncB( thermonuclease family)